MPTWLTVMIAVAAAISAFWVIWKKAVLPFVKAVSQAERSIPVMIDMTEAMAGTPDVFRILNEIVAQLRTNSGSSLLDIVRRMDERDRELEVTAQVMQVNLEAQRRLAEQDRAAVARLTVLLDRVHAKLDVAATAAGVVADELAASHNRADAADLSFGAGAAADAAAMSNPDDPSEGGSANAADV